MGGLPAQLMGSAIAKLYPTISRSYYKVIALSFAGI
jgi:hypothetical protein